MLRVIGGTLLLIGTCMGGGMLALPIVTAKAGPLAALFLMFFCWLVTTLTAFLVLEVNLWFPGQNNLITMSRQSLGAGGQVFAWICTLLLLYSGLSAYIAAGAGVFAHLLSLIQFTLSPSLYPILFTLFFGIVVYLGVRACDVVNRLFMSVKFFSLLVLVLVLLPKINIHHWTGLHWLALLPATTPIVTSFAYAMILPTLSEYLSYDVKKIRIAILLGSMIPFLLYSLWVFTMFGALPSAGPHSLAAISHSANPVEALLRSLQYKVPGQMISLFSDVFASVCVITSFLGVALCLADFLADGLSVKKRGWHAAWINLLVVIPPLLLTLYFPNVFILGVSFAGIFATLLLIILPVLMVWFGRKQYSGVDCYRVAGGKPLLLFLFLSGLFFLCIGILEKLGYL